MLVYLVDHYFVLCYKNNKLLKLQHLLNCLKKNERRMQTCIKNDYCKHKILNPKT